MFNPKPKFKSESRLPGKWLRVGNDARAAEHRLEAFMLGSRDFACASSKVPAGWDSNITGVKVMTNSSVEVALPAFVLSATLRAHGYELTEAQALVVDVAQRLHNGFMQRAVVSARMVKRILRAYHDVSSSEARELIQNLVDSRVIEIVTGDGSRVDIKLVPKFRGLSDDEVTEENAGIGVQVQTLREKASTFKFCNDLLHEASCGYWTDEMRCSTVAGMLLAVFKENCCIDHMLIDDLRKACFAVGMTKLEFNCACAELEGMEIIFFYWCEKTDCCYVRTMDQMGKQYEISASDALKPADPPADNEPLIGSKAIAAMLNVDLPTVEDMISSQSIQRHPVLTGCVKLSSFEPVEA